MSEHDAVAATDTPATVDSLAEDLARLGVRPGETLLVHSSLSSLGWVCGGAVAVIQVLQRALGENGTLVMPTHSTGFSEPSNWKNPPVPEAWWQTIRDTMPAFDPDLTPTRAMGAIPETFRKMCGVVRSYHPVHSFAAVGPNADQITRDHSLDHGFGDQSPLARLYDLNASILLLGVDYERNTSFHLAEHRANFPSKTIWNDGAPVLVNDERRWVPFTDHRFDDTDFNQIGAALEQQTSLVRRGLIARSPARLFPLRATLDFAIRWMEANRQ